MKGKRDSLRVWLEKNLNQNKIPGLEWKDPKKKIFRIRWKHASKHGWSSAVDGCVFREWAIYSGKFKPGEKAHEEPKVWKANFRCALNALPDIQEVVEERETRGNEAQKVFYMRPHFSKHSKRNRESSFRYRNNSSYQGIVCIIKIFLHLMPKQIIVQFLLLLSKKRFLESKELKLNLFSGIYSGRSSPEFPA